MKDITPLIPAGRKIIESYGNGAFKVSGVKFDHNIIVLPGSVHKFESATISGADKSHLKVIEDNINNIEVLLIGCGNRTEFLPKEVESSFKQRNMAIECMDTGAAARTYNVLLSEERKVAVVLIAV